MTRRSLSVFRSIAATALRGAVGAVALLGLCLSALGQGSSAEIRIEEDPTQNDLSAIAGSVVDPADGVIVGAQISVRFQGHGGVAALGETDDRGKFQLTLDPGKYALKVQSYGFNDFSRPFALEPNQKATIKITLEIGNVVGSVVIDPEDE